ncbi:similar to Saccharomyces cerevisiae YGR095C RRP46 Exosome non-catalytic core component [Maudiozyma barnettii]|uniref:Similar to Saccharomyces cerevisiae YGR095C RRP46 Exosome non-catalytic core component n=1 Tax=Maudiozyma barnettii TaxID=61262 RepID=A0A8H2VAW2_9SACH|nr:exosome non-catalytic core subunit RRP46 [Kazachstania barnettii]CAB4251893.1 similar to Saccharomyces cerevisiae YGR095C RRP46 Exosome non-catalytic core component [Kazachstania barnettii]CAD1778207.1 similar to Saccharomyces cerevisiae YGR095C RRP46 Exosome non-catalytic core component [Kazachstania barnettii]
MDAQTGYLENVDGSCLYSLNSTKVISAVTGPVEPKARQELPTQLALEINIRPASGVPTTREVNIQDKVRAIITPILASYKYPRQLCQITLQLLQSGETEPYFHALELIACVNSTTYALVDSGIALKGIALGTTVVISKDNQLITEPTDEILKNSKSMHVVAYMIENNKPSNLLLMDSYGDFDENDILKILEQSEIKVNQLNKTFREYMKEKINNI